MFIDPCLKRIASFIIFSEIVASNLNHDLVVMGVYGEVVRSEIVNNHILVVKVGAVAIDLADSVPQINEDGGWVSFVVLMHGTDHVSRVDEDGSD